MRVARLLVVLVMSLSLIGAPAIVLGPSGAPEATAICCLPTPDYVYDIGEGWIVRIGNFLAYVPK